MPTKVIWFNGIVLILMVSLFICCALAGLDVHGNTYTNNNGFVGRNKLNWTVSWNNPDPNKVYEIYLVFLEKGTSHYVLYKWESLKQ